MKKDKRGIAMWIVGQCLLSELLRKYGISQQQLSWITGISHQQINDFIHNRRLMSLKNAYKIAKALPDCQVEDLYVLVWKEGKP